MLGSLSENYGRGRRSQWRPESFWFLWVFPWFSPLKLSASKFSLNVVVAKPFITTTSITLSEKLPSVEHAVIQQTEKGEVRLIHKRQFSLCTPYPDVIAYVARAHQVFSFEGLYVDKTGIGDAIVDELEAIEGLSTVEGVFFTDVEKENMLNYLKMLMEKKLLKILGDDKQLIAQINEQQYEYLRPKTAQERIHRAECHGNFRHIYSTRADKPPIAKALSRNCLTGKP